MQQVQLTNRVYKKVKRRADEAGFKSVDEYVADVLKDDLDEETENFDYLFTPERLAHIDRSLAQIKAGHGYTMEEVQEHLAQVRSEWIRKNGK